MAPRLYCPLPIHSGMELTLPPHAARHVQVLRLQPGDAVELFHGGLAVGADEGAAFTPLSPCARGAGGQEAAAFNKHQQRACAQPPLPCPPPSRGQALIPQGEREQTPPYTTGHFTATITHMGRSEVRALVGDWHAPLPASHPPIHIACGIPANDRMDWLVEKATELGAASIQPLITARSVLRLSGDRAAKRVAHWQATAVAACEQSGRTAVPRVKPVMELKNYLDAGFAPDHMGLVLALRAEAQYLQVIHQQTICGATASPAAFHLLSGPEGGLTVQEEATAISQGWQAASLGAYVLRAETAPVVALVQWVALGITV